MHGQECFKKSFHAIVIDMEQKCICEGTRQTFPLDMFHLRKVCGYDPNGFEHVVHVKRNGERTNQGTV